MGTILKLVQSKESEPEKSENYLMKRQNRKTGEKSHLTKLGPRDKKFNITEETCDGGRSFRPRTMPCPGQNPDIGNAGCLQ